MDSLAEVAAAHRGTAVLVNAVPSARGLSFEAEAGAPRGYDVIPASHGTISVRQQEIQPSVHNKHQIELHCGPAVIAQPLYQATASDLAEITDSSVQYVTLEEFFDDKTDLLSNTTNQEITETLKSLENPPDHQTVIQVPHIQVPAQAGQNNQKSSQMHDSSPLTPSPSSTSSQDYDLNNLDNDEYKLPNGLQNSILKRSTANNSDQLNFREDMISRVPSSPPGSGEGSDEEMYPQDYSMSRKEVRRRSKKPVPDEKKDETYWRRRLKNNIAAKRSREARRHKESELTKKATVLEMQHEALKSALEHARKMNEELRMRLSKYEDVQNLKVH